MLHRRANISGALLSEAAITACYQLPTLEPLALALSCAAPQGFRFVVFGANGEAVAPPPSPPPASSVPPDTLCAAAALAAATASSAEWRPDDVEAPPTQCCVCWSAHVRVLLLPCAHLCICAACDAGLARRVCPLCREPISATINARFP